MSEKFNRILPHTLKFEGGLTTDHAGLTNYGVTQGSYDAYNESIGKAKKGVDKITYGEVVDLYENDFFKRPKFNKLSENLAGVMFDFGVNSGSGRATKTLQEVVGAEADGIIGKKTLGKVDEFIKENSEKELVNQILIKRSDFLTNLVETNPQKYGQYAKGWANRIESLNNIYNR